MIVKSFVLRRESVKSIVNHSVDGTIIVVRPEKALINLFRAVIHSMIVDKQQGTKDIENVKDYLDAISSNPGYQLKKDEFLEYVQDYLRKSMSYSVPVSLVEDYILAQCAYLCAQAIALDSNMQVIDGRELVVCRQESGVSNFDWTATLSEIELKCKGKSRLVIAGGYARTPQGAVIGIGKGGANMMASLVASALSADLIEFYVEGEGINGIAAMTYDEAAHYCSNKTAPFPAAALWPAKKAGIPIVVKGILHPDFKGTLISSSVESGENKTTGVISGVVVENDLKLVTVYGTGLMGQVGASAAIFSALSKAGINIRFISQTSSEYAISFAINERDGEKVLSVIDSLMADNQLIAFDDVVAINQKVGIVTVYGSRMKNIPGVSGKVFSLLGTAGINVIASAQGGEELSISVVVDEADVQKAKELLTKICG